MRASGIDFIKERGFFGIYRAKVEDVKDTEAAGRVRVRVFGVHSQDPNEVPTNTLPWAYPAMSVLEGNTAGYFSVPAVDSNVWVFFDATNHNLPVYFAAAPDKADWPEGGNTDKTTISFKDGQKFEVDSEASTMSYTHPSGATMRINSDGSIDVQAVQMTFDSDGDMDFTAGGNITMTASGQHNTNASVINHN